MRYCHSLKSIPLGLEDPRVWAADSTHPSLDPSVALKTIRVVPEANCLLQSYVTASTDARNDKLDLVRVPVIVVVDRR
jgi:hypothetical protein